MGAGLALAAGGRNAGARPPPMPRARKVWRPNSACPTQGYRLSDAQAQAILELRLQRLTGLEQDKIVAEYKEVMDKIADLLDILAKPERITEIIVDELTAIKAQFGDKRRSEIVVHAQDLSMEDLITPRGRGGDLVARRLHEVAAARRIHARRSAAGAASRRRRPRKTISSRTCSSPIPTTTSCASPTAARSTGSRSMKCRRAAAARAASRSSICCRWRKARRSTPSCR